MVYDIVGCGAVVRTYHVPVVRYLARQGRLAVRGCFDRDAAAAAAVGQLVRAGGRGGAEAQPGPGADAVLIATPPGSHAAIAQRYLTAGKHVFVEKPFVTAPAEAYDLVERARAASKRLLVAHFRRFYPSLAAARRFLASGGLGRITRVEASEGGRWDWPANSSYFLNDPRGGVVWDTGAHLVDMLLYALSLDEPGKTVEFRTCEVAKRPANEPSHEFRARLELQAGGMLVEVRVALSRLQALAGVLKFHGDGGVLLVPTSFATTATLLRGSERFDLASSDPGLAPADSLGCFLLEHLEFLAACELSAPSRLDAERFVALTSVLAQLTAAPSAT